MTTKTKNSHQDKTSADKSSIGFYYQYYFFLWKVLSLEAGEEVGLEVKDDVHITLSDGTTVLYQLKHSLKTKADGSPANLTTMDTSLWKTLSNWAKIISDENSDRADVDEQKEYLKKTSFRLTSNKSLDDKNIVLDCLSDFRKESIDIDSVIKTFLEIRDSSNSHDVKNYVNDVLCLDKLILKKFLSRISVELSLDDLISKCKESIANKMIPDNRIDDVFMSIDSSIRANNYINIKNNFKNNISYDDFRRRYRKYFDIGRTGKLPIRGVVRPLPSSLKDQVFIKQLIDIGDIGDDEIEIMARYTGFKLKIEDNLERWLQDGELTEEEIEVVKSDAENQWFNLHRSFFKNAGELVDINASARELVDMIRKITLVIDEQSLKSELSNGVYYSLSDDKPKIGWRHDWKKYK